MYRTRLYKWNSRNLISNLDKNKNQFLTPKSQHHEVESSLFLSEKVLYEQTLLLYAFKMFVIMYEMTTIGSNSRLFTPVLKCETKEN